MEVCVLRLGHRLHRDERLSTHCGLVARAFGSSGIVYSGDKDESLLDSVKKTADRWGGSFSVIYEKNWKKIVAEWKSRGAVVLLTMYGINLPDIINEIKEIKKDILVIVGSEKVPAEIYKMVDYQVAVSNQPHSEVAALSTFLDWLYQGKELNNVFKDGEIAVIPRRQGKQTKNN